MGDCIKATVLGSQRPQKGWFMTLVDLHLLKFIHLNLELGREREKKAKRD